MAKAAITRRDELTESIDFVTGEREIIVFRNDRNGKPIAIDVCIGTVWRA